jgi:two-component system chemotaxis response regulator CheY
MVRAFLEAGGHQVVEAAGGAAAVESYPRERPDAVVLDLTMEDLGGLEVLQRIRSLDPTAHVIMTSADDSERGQAEQLGASGFVVKPGSPQQFCSAVEQRKAAAAA